VRDANHWQAGTEFFVEETAGGVVLRPVKSLPASQIEDVAGCLNVTGPRRTIAEMDAAIVVELQRRRDRGRY
jgi:hypothetical protein